MPLEHLPWLNRGSRAITPFSGGLGKQILSLAPTSSISNIWDHRPAWLVAAARTLRLPVKGPPFTQPPPLIRQDSLLRASKIFLALPETGQTGVGRREPASLSHHSLATGSLFTCVNTARCQPSDSWRDKVPGVVVLRDSAEARETVPPSSHRTAGPSSPPHMYTPSSCRYSLGPQGSTLASHVFALLSKAFGIQNSPLQPRALHIPGPSKPLPHSMTSGPGEVLPQATMSCPHCQISNLHKS